MAEFCGKPCRYLPVTTCFRPVTWIFNRYFRDFRFLHRRTHLSLTPEIREAHEATTEIKLRFAGNYSIVKSQQVKQTRLTEGVELNRNYRVVSSDEILAPHLLRHVGVKRFVIVPDTALLIARQRDAWLL